MNRYKHLQELVDALLELDREMQEMIPDSNYSSEYQEKNREWMKLYESIIYFDDGVNREVNQKHCDESTFE